MEVLSLFPLSQSEIANVRPDLIHALFEGSPLSFPNLGPESRSEIIKRVLVGGFPEVLGRESEKRRTQWFNSYISTVIQRDVRDIAQIAELADLPRLLVTLAQRVGSLLNSAELSRTTGIPYTTLLRYLDILTAIFMYQPLPAWSTNLGKRLVKAPKIHLVDSGVAGALRGLDEKSALKFPDRFGPLFENFVISEIRKLRSWSDLDFEMYHYRSSGGAEVDCVLESRRGDIVGIEVKATSSVKSSDFRGLKSLREDSPGQFRRGVVIYDGYEVVAFDEDLLAVPVGALWSNFKI